MSPFDPAALGEQSVPGGAAASPVGAEVWLVRHGESEWNEAGLAQGQADAPGLTAQGIAQAEQAAEELAGSGAGLVLASDLRRAVETARPIAARLGVGLRTDPRLRERALGTAEGRPVTEIPPAILGVANGWVVDADARPPGGESTRQLVARVAALLDELARTPPAPGLVLVSHGGVLRAALGWAEGIRPDEMAWPPLPNATVCRLSLPLR